MTKTNTRTRALVVKGALVGASVLALTGASLTPASADVVNGCAQGRSEWYGTCVWVTTGGKNNGNHTQWVEKIQVNAPREGRNTASTMEAWAGDGPSGIAWYQSGSGTTFTWTINKWIKTDSGICGSYTWPGRSDRSIACITIKA
ncbi:hypothetical protein ACFFQW_46085 [Umezawaea endophytica]|uniref:Peptidase inhibitor family I36 n=1 Tax=Umezawaea endophytica TaxID=1654476 RepID=A0A9X2VZG0_9PSEU|nr:hypothetical protein [Umezawaea endophytica]MCS7484598.1 hypothetical protein [Umezawaea endophytica]